jgi:hypothetical protein
VISIDFVGQGTAMGSTEVAGVASKPNWNNANGLTNTAGQALVDESGTATGATVIWNTNGMWNLPITDTVGNARMMRGYLDTVGGMIAVTVSGLPANSAGYDVYVYADGDNGAAARTGAYQISGTGITTASVNLTDAANTDFSGTFTQANNSNGNYVKFTITAAGFTITATPGAATDGFPRAPVNGIQIVPRATPTPDFTISASPSTQTVNVGNATTYTASVGALNGFTGVVTLSASGLPTGATASFSPATVTGAGSSTLTVTTTGSTPVGTSTLTPTLHLHFQNWRRFPLFPLLACVLMAILRMMRTIGQVERKLSRVSAVALFLGVLMSAASCGGGSSVSHQPIGTPAGTSTITVTGTSANGGMTLQHSIKLTLIVN